MMRTLIGHEAIDVAHEHDILVFDRFQNTEITTREAELLIQKQRDPDSFALEDWPESDKEAEHVVLQRFHVATSAYGMPEATIADIRRLDMVGRSIHPHAARLAANRLVEQNELEAFEDHEDERVYRIPRNTYFKESFLEGLRAQVCDECADLDLEQPFHKTCLMALADYLINEEFTLSDVTETGNQDAAPGRKRTNLFSGARARWLSQTVTATRGRLKSVVKPIMSHNWTAGDEERDRPEPQTSKAQGPVSFTTRQSAEHDPLDGGVESDLQHVSVSVNVDEFQSRDKISKAELIEYLKKVEIVDESGELASLRVEREKLQAQLEAKEQEIKQVERQRMLLQGQCEDMQRDLDTLLEAMQIAKRRGYVSAQPQVIDADVGKS